jgi:hypothetical protein
MRLAGGLDELSLVKEIRTGKGEYAAALTTGSGKGRLIQMASGGNVYNDAIQLQHESYRDGTRSENQFGETVQAVTAHTVMADRMRSAGAGYENTANLARDLAAWDKAVKSGDMTGFSLYAMSNYDSSEDYWKLTADGKMVSDGKATVRDAVTGEVIISLEELGMTDDSDYIGALARMFGINGKKADELNKVNKGSIQLGRGAGIDEDDYADALRYALSGTIAGGMSDAVFNGMTTDEQTRYLKREVIIGSAFIGGDRGAVAEKLRDLNGLRDANILTGLFYTSTPSNSNNGYETAAAYDFMNEPLREFLNLNLNGSSQYTWSDISGQGFSKKIFLGSLYHLDTDYTDVKKYVHSDGREVVWGRNKQTNKHEQINSELYRGTFNYANSSVHIDFDMHPFNYKYGTNLLTAIWSGIRYLATDTAYNIEQTFYDGLSDMTWKKQP